MLSSTDRVGQEMEILQVGKAGLAHIIHDGSWRNRAVSTRDRRAEPRGGVTLRLGVPKGVCPLRGDSTRGLAPL
jgi:hypothetical protein